MDKSDDPTALPGDSKSDLSEQRAGDASAPGAGASADLQAALGAGPPGGDGRLERHGGNADLAPDSVSGVVTDSVSGGVPERVSDGVPDGVLDEVPGESVDPPGRPGMSRRALIALLSSLAFVIVIAGFWLAGRHNSSSYYIHCGDTQITASQGRSFPPWGESRLSGSKWAPIANVLELSQCDDEVFDNRAQLAERYRDILIGQVDTWLQELGESDSRERLPTIRKQLEQAEILSRASDDANKVARKRIGRLLGDVAYWQAHDELAVARSHLQSAAEQLRAATEKKPVHVRDAGEWHSFLEFTEVELGAGPPALRPAPAPTTSADPGGPGASAQGTGAATHIETPAADPVDAPTGPGDDPANDPDIPARPAVPNPPPPASGTLL